MSKVLRIKSRLRDYDVHFVPDCTLAIGNQKQTGAFLIVDKDLPGAGKYIKLFSLQRVISFKATESNKTLVHCSGIIRELVDKDIRRNNTIFALGGGVVEDVAAFVSTVLFRGVEWVFCPTTLLAQADSCIGSKSSINFGSYKNLLGSFYPPRKVIIDVNFLKTLCPDEVRSGIGEILHFYFVAGQDKLAKRMMGGYSEFIKDPRALKPYILASLKIKKDVIERDELDQAERNLFNYGHTFGHAIESVSGYRINHGQAVSRGMDIANYLSWQRKYISEDNFKSMHEILKSNLPVYSIDHKNWPRFFQALSKDKKNIGGTLGCILTRGSGKMFKAQVPFDDRLRDGIISYFEAY